MPELHIVAGPNGVGKTTAFATIVPQGLDYINADLIAKTIKEKAGGLNTQDIANQEAVKIFYEKAARQESFVSKPIFTIWKHTSPSRGGAGNLVNHYTSKI